MSHIRLPRSSELRTLIKYRNHWYVFIGCIPSFMHHNLDASGHVAGDLYIECKTGTYTLGNGETDALVKAYNEGKVQEVSRIRGLEESEFMMGNNNVILMMSISSYRKDFSELYALQEKQFGPPTDPKVIECRKAQREAERALLAAKNNARQANYALERTSYDCTFAFVPEGLDEIFK